MTQSSKFVMLQLALFNNSTWTAVVCPLTNCKRVVLVNPDGSDTISVCTDTGDANSIDTIAATGGQFEVKLGASLFSHNEVICYVKGAGAAPLQYFFA